MINIDPVADYVFDKLAKAGYNSLSEEERAFVCVWSAWGEIGNGGFDQFYFNTSGDWAVDTPLAFRLIGANQTADLIEEANSFFGDKGPNKDRSERQKDLDALPEEVQDRFEQLEEIFFQDPDDIETLLASYCEQSAFIKKVK